MEPVYRYRAEVLRVIDGDSFHAKIDLGFRVHLIVPVRVRGVDAPELGTHEGKLARAWAIEELSGTPLVVESHKDRQSFARWVCDIWTPDGSYADRLIEAGHAVAV